MPAKGMEKFANKLVTAADLVGWIEADPAEAIYEDGLCKIFWPQGPAEMLLIDCVSERSVAYNINYLQAFYIEVARLKEPLLDLKPSSKYNYDAPFLFYAYLDANGYAKYAISLEKEAFVYNAALITPRFGLGINFVVGLRDRFDEAIDDLLHRVMMINLERHGL